MSPIEIQEEIIVKTNILHSMARIIVLLFCTSLLIPFQNCSVYKSEGRKDFSSSLDQAADKGCYPYIDTNLAMEFMDILDDSLNVYKNKVEGEDAHSCDFRAAGHLLNHINCKISQGNGEHALLLKQNGALAFEDTQAIWTAPAAGTRPGFVGNNHGGYITLDADGLYTIKYLALDDNELKGVGCAVRLTIPDYNTNAIATQNTLSKITLEMAMKR